MPLIFALLSLAFLVTPGFAGDRDLGTATRAVEITGRKVALVVGNGAYQNTSRLRQAPLDADAVALVLRGLGFEVVQVDDAGRAGLSLAIIEFERRLKGADVGFFYYAGHAVQVGGDNYLVPVDAKLDTRDHVDVDAINARKVLVAMQASGSRLNVAVFDACRNNPWASSWFSDSKAVSGSRGLAEMRAPSGFVLGFATGPGDVAADDGAYAGALVRHIATPGLRIEDVFAHVHYDVNVRNPAQVPWLQMAKGPEAFCPAGCETAHDRAVREVVGRKQDEAARQWAAVTRRLAQDDPMAGRALAAWVDRWARRVVVVEVDGQRIPVEIEAAGAAFTLLDNLAVGDRQTALPVASPEPVAVQRRPPAQEPRVTVPDDDGLVPAPAEPATMIRAEREPDWASPDEQIQHLDRPGGHASSGLALGAAVSAVASAAGFALAAQHRDGMLAASTEAKAQEYEAANHQAFVGGAVAGAAAGGLLLGAVIHGRW